MKEGMATHFSVFAPNPVNRRLQPIGLQSVGHTLSNLVCMHTELYSQIAREEVTGASFELSFWLLKKYEFFFFNVKAREMSQYAKLFFT